MDFDHFVQSSMEYLWIQLHFVISMFTFLSTSSFASQYKVGDSVWSIPPSPNFYSNWSSHHQFMIHDTLCFEFETGSHDVMQVSKLDYNSCTTSNPFRAYRAGPAKVSLIEKGVLYFICNVSDYCFLGQKVTVAVNDQPARNATTSPSSSPAPSPNPVTPRSIVPTTSPESRPGLPGLPIPRPQRSNLTLRGVLLVVILMVVVTIVVCT